MIYTRKLLSDNQLAHIRELIPQLEWVSGNDSVVGNFDKTKRNSEALLSPALKEIESLIISAVNNDREFLSKTQAISSTDVIISKMGPGDFYKPHHDSWAQGDFSTTVFLTDSLDCIGGYLNVDGVEYKPAAGHAVTYETGSLHSVNEVRDGERIVAVFWTHSGIRDRFIRDICSKLTDAYGELEPSTPDTVEEAAKDPYFLIQSCIIDLQRKYRR